MNALRLFARTALTTGIIFFQAHAMAQSNYGEAGAYSNNPSSGAAAEANTNLATGSIAPTLPLLTLPGTAGSIAMALQYTAGSGVKVNDIASDVGLGWNLSGGGAIVRDVKGRPDDGEYGWFVQDFYKQVCFNGAGPMPSYCPPFNSAGDVVRYFKHDYTYTYPSSSPAAGSVVHYGATQSAILFWLYPASQMSSLAQYNAATWQPNTPVVTSGSYEGFAGVFLPDNEPDIYTIVLPTGKLQFVFDPEGQPIPLQAQDIKIEANLGSLTYQSAGLLHEFTVTTSDGVKYYFGSSAQSQAFKESMSVGTKIMEIFAQPSKDDYSCIYKWLLKRIVYPSGEEVTYSYSSGRDYNIATSNYLQQDFVYNTLGGNSTSFRMYQPDPALSSFAGGSWRKRYTVRTTITSTNCMQLERIESSQGKIELTYQTAVRRDVGGTTRPLASMRLLNKQGELVKQLDFIQHYAEQAVDPLAYYYTMPYDPYHLMLDRVIDRGTGCDFTKLYQLEYNAQSFWRNTALKDDWGYLNGLSYPSDGNLVGAYSSPSPLIHSFSKPGRDRRPVLAYAQSLILQSITSANGGKQSFEYELHDCSQSGSNSSVGGLRIKKITRFDGIDHAHDVIDAFAYRKASNSAQSSGCFIDVGSYAKLQLIHGIGNGGLNPGPNYHPTASQIRGYIPDCVTSVGGAYDFFYLLRSDASMYQYAADYVDYSCVTVTHGQKGKTRYEFTSWADVDHQDYVDSDTRQRANSLNLCSNDPLHPSRRGQTLPLPFTYNSINGVSMGYADAVTASFPCRTSRAAERGLPLLITQLDNSDRPVASTFNTYAFTSTNTVNAVVVRPDMEVLCFSQYPRYFQLYYYNVESQWCPLQQSTEIVYDQKSGGDIAKSVATTTVINYQPGSFFPSKVTKYTSRCTSPTDLDPPLASGRYYVTESRRAQSFNGGTSPGVIDQTTMAALLRGAGMTAPVIEQEEYTTSSIGGQAEEHLGASLTHYQSVNGRIVPVETYKSPVVANFTPAYTILSNNVWNFMTDPSYRLTSTVTGYNAEMLPVNAISRDGIPRATIWGYAHTLPIATVVNGNATIGTTGTGLMATAGHTSFEETVSDGDNWELPLHFSSDAKTGMQSARFVRSQSQWGLNKRLVIPAAQRRGILLFSCWAKVPAGITSSATFVLVATAGPGINAYPVSAFQAIAGQDWRYYEFPINLEDTMWGSPGQDLSLLNFLWFQNGDELLLDEVRIHPSNAQMQTTTYQPLVGKTSSTDATGRTTYFTYDSNNEPYLVLNHNHDVITRTLSKAVNQASLTADFSMPGHTVQNSVDFVAELSDCTDGATFIWDFGEGDGAVTGPGRQNHVYNADGTYNVTLIVTHPTKGVAKITKPVTVVVCTRYFGLTVLSGDLEPEYCATPSNPNYVSVELESTAFDNCYPVVSYRWQMQTGQYDPGGSWSDIPSATSRTFSFDVPCFTRESYRCIVTFADGTTNEVGIPASVTSRGNIQPGCACP